MDCRVCREPMEREDCYQISVTRGIINKAATYVCNTCGRSYWWELKVPGLTPLFAKDDFEEIPSCFLEEEDAR